MATRRWFIIAVLSTSAIVPSLAATRSANFLIRPNYQHSSTASWSEAKTDHFDCLLHALNANASGFNVRLENGVLGDFGSCQLIVDVDWTKVAFTRGSFFYSTSPSDIKSSYVVSEDLLEWDAAKVFCSQTSPSSHLVAVETKEEQDSFGPLLGKGKYWIGARRTDGGARYDIFWYATGMRLSEGFTNWKETEPNMTGSCIHIKRKAQRFYWFDSPCTDTLRFICEFQN